MKRIELPNNSNPHFIGSWNILDDNLCKNIINFFKNHPEMQKKEALVMGLMKN